MPALRYMGRRWGIGADELALPSLCSMSLRVVWTIALVVILVRVFFPKMMTQREQSNLFLSVVVLLLCTGKYVVAAQGARRVFVGGHGAWGIGGTWAHVYLSSPLSTCWFPGVNLTPRRIITRRTRCGLLLQVLRALKR